MREYWNMHDTLQTKISTLKAANKEQAKNDKLVKALGWIVGFDGDQHTTTKAQQTLKENE